MPYLLAILGIAIAAYLWSQRARAVKSIAEDLSQLPADTRAAARRWNFRRRTDLHPVEGIEDARLAIGGLAAAFVQLDDLPTAETRARMDAALQEHLTLTGAEAEEITTLGNWFVRTCGGPEAAISRLARKLYRIDQGATLPALLDILDTVAGEDLSRRQAEAIEDIQRAFRVS